MSVIRLAPPPAGDDGFGDLHGALAAEIDALRCVEVVMARNHERLGQELDAAYGLLIETIKRIDQVHSKLDEWHVGRRRRSEP